MISCLIWLPCHFRPAEGKTNKQMTISPVTVHTSGSCFSLFFFPAKLRWPTVVVMTTPAICVFGQCLVRGPATGSSLLTSSLQGSCLTQPPTQESGCLSPRGSTILLGTAPQETREWAGARGLAEVSWRQHMLGGRDRQLYGARMRAFECVCVCVWEIYGRAPCKLSHTLKSWEGRCKVQMLLEGEGMEIRQNK